MCVDIWNLLSGGRTEIESIENYPLCDTFIFSSTTWGWISNVNTASTLNFKEYYNKHIKICLFAKATQGIYFSKQAYILTCRGKNSIWWLFPMGKGHVIGKYKSVGMKSAF